MVRLLVVFLSCILAIQANDNSFFDGACKQRSDCQENECCAIGMQRYSLPGCKPLGIQDSWCYVGAQGETRTLHYPNGQYLEVSDLYTLFCPCQKGYQCVRNKCEKE